MRIISCSINKWLGLSPFLLKPLLKFNLLNTISRRVIGWWIYWSCPTGRQRTSCDILRMCEIRQWVELNMTWRDGNKALLTQEKGKDVWVESISSSAENGLSEAKILQKKVCAEVSVYFFTITTRIQKFLEREANNVRLPRKKRQILDAVCNSAMKFLKRLRLHLRFFLHFLPYYLPALSLLHVPSCWYASATAYISKTKM